jgi:hypothetical protein
LLKGGHREIESKIEPRRQAKSSYVVAAREKIRGMLHIGLALTVSAMALGAALWRGKVT